MNDTPLRLLDLSLLNIFAMLLEEGSVTRAAKRLNLTPSAVSHGLIRLRGVMRDDLFVRTSQGMQPTALALDVGPRLREALRQLEAALVASNFDAAVSERRFVMAMPPYLCCLLLPCLTVRFRREAPRAELRVLPRFNIFSGDLESGAVDVVIGQFKELPERINADPLLEDSWNWVTRSGLLKPGAAITLEEISAHSHVAVMHGIPDLAQNAGARLLEETMTWTELSAVQRVLAQAGLNYPVGLSVPDAITALAVVAGSDMAAFAPRRLALYLAPLLGLTCYEPPRALPPLNFRSAYHRASEGDPGLIWFRSLLKAASCSMPA